jgi:hypothetical protein
MTTTTNNEKLVWTVGDHTLEAQREGDGLVLVLDGYQILYVDTYHLGNGDESRTGNLQLVLIARQSDDPPAIIECVRNNISGDSFTFETDERALTVVVSESGEAETL